MPWRPLPRIAVAVAVYPFTASSPADLPLEIGDDLYIIEQGGKDGSWYRGYLVAPPSLLAGLTSSKGKTLEARVFSGVFPKCCIEVREHLGDGGAEGQPRAHGDGDGESRADRKTSESPRRHASSMRKGVAHKKASELSIGKKELGIDSDMRKDAIATKWPADLPTQTSTENANGPSLSRSLSHRSLKSSQLRHSPDLSSYPLDLTRDPSGKRPQAPVPMLKIGDETPTSTSEPLVDEIASCVREWHSKNLHQLLLARRYSVLDRLSALINRLDMARRQLLYGVLTAHELDQLREEVVWNLVSGNKMLNDEVIVRDPRQSGRLLTCDDSPFEMSTLQSSMSLLDRPLSSAPETIDLTHLMVELTGFAANGLLSPTVSLHLCARDSTGTIRQVTEGFAIEVPSSDIFQKPDTSSQLRTLFADLTMSDTGEASQPGTDLYLVAKVQANHPVQSTPTNGRKINRTDDDGKLRPVTSNAGTSPKGGRQSLMWAQKSFGSVRSRSQNSLKASFSQGSPMTKVDENPRPTTQDSPQANSQHNPQYVRRNFGIGAVKLKSILSQASALEESVTIWSPASIPSENTSADDTLDDILRSMLWSKSGSYSKTRGLDYLTVRLQPFRHADVSQLIAKTSNVPQGVTITPKTEFPGVPDKARSDIYLTLQQVNLPHQALLSHPERGTVPLPSGYEFNNIQLTLEVRRSNGQRIDDCIIPFSDSQGAKAWRSPALERGEAWNQMIKLSLPVDDVPDVHLIMSLADAPGFPFALCYMPLWAEGAFIKDGSHSPLLYLYDKSTSSHEKGRGAYLDLPWSSRGPYDDEKDETLTGPVATLKIDTKLCSTHFSQDKILLGILNWRSQSKIQTIGLVKRISFVPEIEIVKMIDDVLDALFSIMVNQSGEEEHEDAVFAALVLALGIVFDRRFNLEPHVDNYAETKFDHPYAAPCLLRAYTRLLSDHSNVQKPRQVRAAFKVGRLILKFILNAREKQQEKEAGIGTTTQSAFKRDLKGIFRSFGDLIEDPSPALIGNKTLVVQHMPNWLPELSSAFSEEEILQLASEFVDACANVQGKLIMYKLVLILKLLDSDTLTQSHVRNRIISNTAKWIEPYWGLQESPSSQWWEQTRLCCSIISQQVGLPGFDGSRYVGKILESYQSLMVLKNAQDGVFSPLFPSTYPFQTRPIKRAANFNEVLIELAAVLTSLLDSPFSYASDMSLSETTDLMSRVLDVVTSVISGHAFPRAWLSLFVYHHKSMIHVLNCVFDILQTRLLPSPEEAEAFNTDIWSKYLQTTLLLVGSETLALETFPEQKRRAVWKIAGDVREQGSNLLKKSWEAIGWEAGHEDQKRFGLQRLGGFQVQYVPALVPQVVELCLSAHQGLRRVAVRIFQSMIISEWTLNEDLAVVQAEMIDALDKLYKTRDIANSLVQKMFINELLDAFEALARMPLDPLWQAIRDMVSTVDELLELLTAVHGDDNDESSRTMDTLMLMNFYKDMQKEDIFIRYVHQLAKMQNEIHNKTEAGLALQLHADLYTWEATPVRELEDPSYPQQTSFERKEALNFEMIKYFEEGGAWDSALASYRELSGQYETVYYDYAKLARTQRAMATIYETIGRGDWYPPRYFRVIYLGLGFQDNVRDRQYIYQGEPSERQNAFIDRLRQLNPSAQILTKGDPEDMEGQYLQVQPVSVYRDLDNPIYQQPKVVQSTREYVTASRPHRFAVTSKRHSPVSGVQDQWIEKTIFTTREAFPTILRRSEIVSIDAVQLTPLQTAVERTTRKTAELAALAKRVANGDDSGISNLTEAIISSVDPTSVATVAQYRALLPERPASDEDEEEAEEPTMSPLQNALQIALHDHVSNLKHCLTHYAGPLHGGTHSSLSENLHHTFAPELAVLYPPSAAQPEPELQDLLLTPPSTSAGAPSTVTTIPMVNGTSAPTPDALLPKSFSPAPKSRINFDSFKTSFKTPSQNKPETALSALSDGSSPRATSRGNTSASSKPLKSATTANVLVQTNGTHQHQQPEQRPGTSQSGTSRSGSTATSKMKKRFSLLGIGRMGSKLDRSRVDGMAAVGEE